ncbi:hypothetical protein INR49_016482 [Caranx melampygus]|nr:hypothetical protein INR49_016482 [Caranx melampygus]
MTPQLLPRNKDLIMHNVFETGLIAELAVWQSGAGRICRVGYLLIISGAMKAGVPAVLDRRASVPSNSLLTPKSAILTCPSSPSRRLEACTG